MKEEALASRLTKESCAQSPSSEQLLNVKVVPEKGGRKKRYAEEMIQGVPKKTTFTTTKRGTKGLKIPSFKKMVLAQEMEVQPEPDCRHGKCHFLYTIPILGKIIYPKKCVIFGNTKFATKQQKQKIQ